MVPFVWNDPEIGAERGGRRQWTAPDSRPVLAVFGARVYGSLHMQLHEGGTMDPAIARALAHRHTIDITTTGRRSGLPRRIEVVFHNFDDRLYIAGMPNPGRTRAWIHNLTADPHLAFHLKGPVKADLRATARIITDLAERRAVFTRVARVWRGQDVEIMTRHSPLIEVTIDGLAAATAA
jgi:deazaflavin-dependent oxidoreductase (nitroreductase family)